MRTRGNTKSEPAHDADFESWISGLTDGETSVRRLRKKIGSVGSGECQACEQAATGELDHAGHEDGKLTA